jgi:hypothetical protein
MYLKTVILSQKKRRLNMNNILEKILAKKSPEEFAKEISEVRKIVGKDNKFDMSVEDALGIDVEPTINFN